MINLVADIDYVLFIFLAVGILFFSIYLLESKDMSHAIIFLAITFVGIAGIYLLLSAEFLFLIQMTVYAGGVIILFLFALMLTRTEEFVIRGNMGGWKTNAVFAVLLSFFLLIFLSPAIFHSGTINFSEFKNIGSLGFKLFDNYLAGFIILGFILITVLIGAVYLIKNDEDKVEPIYDRAEFFGIKTTDKITSEKKEKS